MGAGVRSRRPVCADPQGPAVTGYRSGWAGAGGGRAEVDILAQSVVFVSLSLRVDKLVIRPGGKLRNSVASRQCLLPSGRMIMTSPLVPLGCRFIRTVVVRVVLVETLERTFLLWVRWWSQWTVAPSLIRITLLTNLIPSILGIKFVLTFRTPRGLGALLDSIRSLVGLIVTV